MTTRRWTVDTARTHVRDAADELALIWQPLVAALTRDGGTTAAERVATTTDPGAGPVNPDVLRALTTLTREVPATDWWLCTLTGEPYRRREVPAALHRMPRMFDRLAATNALPEAQRLDHDLNRWRRLAKRGVGLLAYDRPLGQWCPRHDDPLTELVELGDEGWLQHTREGIHVLWALNGGRVHCHHCNSGWGPGQLLLLGQMLTDADRRRVEAEQAKQAA